jgi:hypothetical protein
MPQDKCPDQENLKASAIFKEMAGWSQAAPARHGSAVVQGDNPHTQG